MSKTLQWVLGAGALVLVFAMAASMILPFFFPTAAVGYGRMDPGMMRGWGGMGGAGLGMFTWPLLLILLVIAGAFWFGRPQPPSTATAAGEARPSLARSCPTCGRSLQADWKACPHCGERL